MKAEKILELLWELKSDDKFYFMTYGKDLLVKHNRFTPSEKNKGVVKCEQCGSDDYDECWSAKECSRGYKELKNNGKG